MGVSGRQHGSPVILHRELLFRNPVERGTPPPEVPLRGTKRLPRAPLHVLGLQDISCQELLSRNFPYRRVDMVPEYLAWSSYPVLSFASGDSWKLRTPSDTASNDLTPEQSGRPRGQIDDYPILPSSSAHLSPPKTPPVLLHRNVPVPVHLPRGNKLNRQVNPSKRRSHCDWSDRDPSVITGGNHFTPDP